VDSAADWREAQNSKYAGKRSRGQHLIFVLLAVFIIINKESNV
jgi:uncharacterized integral membrane protein